METVYKKARPGELTTFLLNPHKGFATFQHFEGDPLYPTERWSEEGPTEFPERVCETAEGYLPTTVAYCRWFWEVVEPEEGRYDFTVVERALETARSRGQTLHVRIMPHGAAKQPWAPAWYLEKYPSCENDRFDDPYTVPVYDSPEYIDIWSRLVSEFGSRFDADRALDCVDMSYVGAWGEGQGECSNEAADRITKAYADAHPRAKRVAMVSDYKMTAGIRSGSGWRCDSCDDLGLWADSNLPFSAQWNHLYDCYPESVVTCGAQDAWKTAPVVYEPGQVLMTDYRLGFDLDFIIQQDLKYHGSVFSGKSTRLPEPWMEKLRKFANDLGYRFVLRQFKFQAKAARGEALEYSAWIENVGVAPIYYRYPLALRLTQGRRVHVEHPEADITAWLPGDAFVSEGLTVPPEFEPGGAELHCAIIDPDAGSPRVRFASEGADADGWLPVGTVEIT